MSNLFYCAEQGKLLIKSILWVFVAVLAACTSQEKTHDKDVSLKVVLYSGFFDSPSCELLNSNLLPVNGIKIVPNRTKKIKLPQSSEGYVIRCKSLDAAQEKLVFHSVLLPTQIGTVIQVAVNPITEVAYRLSVKNITEYAVHLSRVLLNMGMYVDSPEGLLPIPVTHGEKIQSYYVSVIELLRITSGMALKRDEASILMLNDRIGQMESAARDDVSISSIYTQSELRAFIELQILSDNLKDMYKNNYTEKMDQQSLYFSSPLITRFLSTNDYNQSALGGGGTGNVSYESSDSAIASVDNEGKVTLLRVGKVKITAIKAEDENYNKALASYDIVISKDRKDQPEFSFLSARLVKNLNEGEFENAVNGGTGEGLIYYRSSDRDKAEVYNDGRVVLKDLGDVTITAHKGGDDDYHNAEASYALSITGAKLQAASGDVSVINGLQDTIKNLQPFDTLYLSGEYFFDPPINLNGVKGQKNGPIRLIGAPGGTTTFTGVQSLNAIKEGEWQQIEDGAHLKCKSYCYKIKVKQPVYDLWVNGQRQKVASWPNYKTDDIWEEKALGVERLQSQQGGWWHESTWALVANFLKTPRASGGFMVAVNNDNTKHSLKGSPSFSGGRLLIKDKQGNHQNVRIERHDKGTSKLTFFSVLPITLSSEVLFRIEHAAALDQAGEYFYHADTRELWIWPVEGKHPNELTLAAKTQTHALDITDSEYILLDNINFHETTIKCAEKTRCQGISIKNSVFENPVSYQSLLQETLWPNALSVTGGLAFDASLYTPSYFVVDAEPWASMTSATLLEHAEQQYWLPLWVEYNRANIPSVEESNFSLNQDVVLKWLPATGVTQQQVWVGEFVDDLSPACMHQDIERDTLSSCTVSTYLKPDTTYYWQIVSFLGTNPYKSAIFSFTLHSE